MIVERENTFVHLNVHPKKQKINGHVCKRKIDDTHEGATKKEKRVKEKKIDRTKQREREKKRNREKKRKMEREKNRK